MVDVVAAAVEVPGVVAFELETIHDDRAGVLALSPIHESPRCSGWGLISRASLEPSGDQVKPRRPV
jgi:hypothetical protein